MTLNIKQIRAHFKKLKDKIQPGQTMEEALQQEIDADNYPKTTGPNLKTQAVLYMIIDKSEVCTVYTDLTGRFP